jgi:hypothetical protein
MRPGRQGRLAAAVIAAAALVAPDGASPALAQDAGQFGPAILPVPESAEGAPIESVRVRVRQASGDTRRDAAAEAAAQKVAAFLVGQTFTRPMIEATLAYLRGKAGIADASYRLLLNASSNSLTVVIELDAERGEAEAAPTPDVTGVLTGDASAFPLLRRDQRSMLTAIVGGGFGSYADIEPWFGQPLLFNEFNPLAGHLPGSATAWGEGSFEYGAGGVTQLGDHPVYAFGAATGMLTWSVMQDIFTDQTRVYNAVEKAYAGVFYADRSSGNRAGLSLGRQTYTLNDGFLINMVKGSSNVGERGATYLGPRLASDFSVIGGGRYGAFGAHAFYIDPNELEQLESDTTFLGFNARYAVSDTIAADASVITIPTSRSTYANPYGLTLPRRDTTTIAAHLRWRDLGLKGVWFEGEAAWQTNPDYAMSAWAWYTTLGYIALDRQWTPSVSYRFSYFSGDDPDTETYERYDPLMNTGLGIWLQGVSFGKITSNSNLAAHRIQANVAPTETMNVTFDYFRLSAPELNNLGSNPALSQLSSRDLGQEASITLRWSLSKNLYLQSLVSTAIPGEALRDIGADKPWTTLQLSLYWGL